MSQATGARILVVDDEPAIVRAVELNLRRHQFQVDSARTGQAALEAMTRPWPDLVLLDLGLPDLDGLDVIRPKCAACAFRHWTPRSSHAVGGMWIS